jgi:putative transposase
VGSHNTKSDALHSTACASTQLFGDWFDPIETAIRARVRSFIEELIEAELEEALSRPRYGRAAKSQAETGGTAAGVRVIDTATGRVR